MKKYLLILLLLLIFWNSQMVFAWTNLCSSEEIWNYFIDQEDNFQKKDKEDLQKFIKNKINFYQNIQIWEKNEIKILKKMNNEFIRSQDRKFELSIKYAIKKFAEDNWNSNLKWIRTQTYLTKLKKEDFFIKNFLDLKEKKWILIENIPTSILQKSVYLDFLIFSCEIWKFNPWNNFISWWSIINLLSATESDDYKKEEILEKQKIVIKKAIDKYQSFLTNRVIYTALRW